MAQAAQMVAMRNINSGVWIEISAPPLLSNETSYFFKKNYLFIYLAVLGLSCGMWDLVP